MAEQKTAWRASLGPLARLRLLGRRIHRAVRAKYWFPHLLLAVAVALEGLFVLWSRFGTGWWALLARFPSRLLSFSPSSMPFLLIGLALLLMSVGLMLRSRFAWVITVMLTIATILILLLFPRGIRPGLLYYDGFLLFLLLVTHGAFTRSSPAAGTLFAVTSTLLLLIYAVFGTMYLGSQFSPPVKTLAAAFYYSVETMSTVGYGEIVPKTLHARLFAVSIIILGIGVFATSITAIIGPVVTLSVDRMMHGREKRMKRSDHFIIVGATPLAFNTCRELYKRQHPVTLILMQKPAESEFEDADIVIGDANDLEVLRKAGAEQAQAVLALRADDSENAFIALAVKELKGKAKTIVAVNDSKHFERVRLAQPDFVIAPQALGAEMLAMVLSGEAITSEFVTESFLHSNPHRSSNPSPS